MEVASSPHHKRARVAIDIGSTIVKLATLDEHGRIESQQLFPRDFEAGIARQVEGLLHERGVPPESDDILVCSSANGGLRVGIVCLSTQYSGAALRNQVLLAGANPVFVHGFEEARGSLSYVDMLLVGGGIDCGDATPLQSRLLRFDPGVYRYGSLVYAGNAHLAPMFQERFPAAAVVPNPLHDGLAGRRLSVFEAVRGAYLNDLIYKEGVTELRSNLATGIRPTPEIVSQGFRRALANSSRLRISGPCIVLDIGGATTDLHYSIEVVRDDSEQRPSPGVSVGRFVFTDLGIVASRDSLLLQLRNHPRLYDFLRVTTPDTVRESYSALRDSDHVPSASLLAYACLFIALDRFAEGRGPGLPTGDLDRVAQLILTGGAAQPMQEPVVQRLFGLFASASGALSEVAIDRRYELWIEGITWDGKATL